MSSWGNKDAAANAPYWAVNSSITHQADVSKKYAKPTAANVNLLYANTTSGVYINNEVVGLDLVSTHETQVAAVNGTGPKTAHSGWVLRTTGTGGRAGRTSTEVLVALSTTIGPTDGDGETWANTFVVLTAPSSASGYASSTNANTIIFTTTATQYGNTYGGVLYQWQYNNSSGILGWTNVANSSPANTYYLGGTSATLTVYPKKVDANGYVYRVVGTAAQDASVSTASANATITVFTGA